MDYVHFHHLIKKGLATPEIVKAFVKEHGLEGMTEAEILKHVKQTVKFAGTKINKFYAKGK